MPNYFTAEHMNRLQRLADSAHPLGIKARHLLDEHDRLVGEAHLLETAIAADPSALLTAIDAPRVPAELLAIATT